MPKSCEQRVYNLGMSRRKKCVQSSTARPHLRISTAIRRGKRMIMHDSPTEHTQDYSTGFLPSLPQLLSRLSTLSTPPIISTTNYIKGE